MRYLLDRRVREWTGDLLGILAFFAITLLSMLFGSCKTTKDVQKDSTSKTDTCYVSKVEKDSVWLHDSIYEKEYLEGDTVVRYKYVQKLQYVYKTNTDTIYKAKSDTIYQYREKVTEKKPFLYGLKNWLFWLVVAVVGILLLYYIGKTAVKRIV